MTALHRMRAEDGFGLIEVLVAALMLGVLVIGASGLLVTGENGSAAAVTNTQLVAVAEQQLQTIADEVKTQGFAALAMSTAPSHTPSSPLVSDATTQSLPSYFVDAGTENGGCGVDNVGFDIEEDWDDTSAGVASGVNPWSGCTHTSTVIAEPLEVISGGFVPAAGQTVSVGGRTATVYTYVTDTYVGCVNNSTNTASCPTTDATTGLVSGCTTAASWPSSINASTPCADARRVTVAVVPASSARLNVGRLSPVYESTVFTAPTPSNAPSGTLGLTLGLQLG
jgi:type II secretory pathway pseudopilin PulG